MPNDTTVTKLHEMKLSIMAQSFRQQLKGTEFAELSFEERFGLLVDAEWTSRKNNRLSRLIKNAGFAFNGACITEKGIAETLFYDLVQQCRDEGIIIGSTIAIDSTAIDAYEAKQPKSKSQETGNATWGAKYDTFRNKITWFGYKIHLAVDTDSELPVALEVTPANVNDGDMGPVLVEKVASQAPKGKLAYILEDAGYDQLKNYGVAKAHGAQAIIPLNPRNAKEPPGFYNKCWGNQQEKIGSKINVGVAGKRKAFGRIR